MDNIIKISNEIKKVLMIQKEFGNQLVTCIESNHRTLLLIQTNYNVTTERIEKLEKDMKLLKQRDIINDN